MTLKQIIKNYTWLNIKLKLLGLYPDEEDSLLAYEAVFEKLIFMKPITSDIMLQLSKKEDDFDGSSYVDVSGKDLNPDPNMPYFTDNCAIEFTPWNQWLGMEITKDTLANFTELEIFCHSLYEMTFIDFEEESIQDEMKRINDVKDEFLNMSEDEKKRSSRSIEDLLNELDDEEK